MKPRNGNCAAWHARRGDAKRALEWTCLGLRALRVHLPLCPACEVELELMRKGKAR